VTTPSLLVLDFDGVVCDGMQEFFESSWRAWARTTGNALPAAHRAQLSERFANLRPVVESGWEMAMLPALLETRPPAHDHELEANWPKIRDAFLKDHGLAATVLAAALDTSRDEWTTSDATGWLASHRFYPGIADWLRNLLAANQLVYVLSTKEKRFVDLLLQWQRVPLPPTQTIGKATPRRAKWKVIEALIERHDLPTDGEGVWFVEDRLETLRELRKDAPHLRKMHLFLATWGYVFPRDVTKARGESAAPLTLAEATAPLGTWPRSAPHAK
jgi:hypothetical protein